MAHKPPLDLALPDTRPVQHAPPQRWRLIPTAGVGVEPTGHGMPTCTFSLRIYDHASGETWICTLSAAGAQQVARMLDRAADEHRHRTTVRPSAGGDAA